MPVRSVQWILLVCGAACPGCYLSHELPVEDGGEVVLDTGVLPDGGACQRVDALLIFGPTFSGPGTGQGLGSLIVESATGEELYRDGHDGNSRFHQCFPRAEGPLTLVFAQEGGPNAILDVNEDFDSESWGRGPHLALDRDDLETGRLERQEPDSVFRLQVSSNQTRTLADSPFQVPCRGILGPCRLRFIELDAAGDTLGGGAFEHRDGRGEELVLDARGSTVASGRFRVALASGGLLRDGRIAEVWPLDCRGRPGPALPGELDLWRCAYAGSAVIETTSGDVVEGRFTYRSGPTDALVADTLVARVVSPDERTEAYAFAPCCGAGPSGVIELRFPDGVNRLEAGGRTWLDFHFDVDAPAYEHPFAYTRESGNTERLWGFASTGRARMDRMPNYFRDRFAGRPPLEEVWIGAITTRDRPPWAAGAPVAMVRRRIVP